MSEIEIDGHVLTILSYSVQRSINDVDRLTMSVTGGSFPFGNTPRSFMWNGDNWDVTALSIEASTSKALTMTLEAAPAAPEPKPKDPHIYCVPKDHYNDLKGLMVWLLNTYHSGHITIDNDTLAELEEWQIVHTGLDSEETNFLAIPPEVSIG